MAVDRISRRGFLSLSARAAAAAPLLALVPRRVLAAGADVPDGVIVRNDWPEHWESSLAALDGRFHTPARVLFVRSHMPVPDVNADAWRLEVTGLVERPLQLSLADLRRLPSTTQDVTLECAGNGRGLYALANTSGTQWGRGAVGNARWTGVRMSTLLERAGVKPEAKHVWLECADKAPLGNVPPFLRSIPLEKAQRDALLVWGMNGLPLPRLHGAPLRAIVPGWFGMASAKWVVKMRVEAEPSPNHFMARGYRYNYPGDTTTPAPPVEAMVVKSLITSPREGASVRANDVVVRGVAWTGDGTVTKVEVGLPRGNWIEARFLDPPVAGTWRRWSVRITVPTGAMTLRARAIDSHGQVQPDAARANNAGYANNSIHEVNVRAS
jgi:DMSO/TMAO reductase YedYZ molybdopterin-dependent catalytic subunit